MPTIPGFAILSRVNERGEDQPIRKVVGIATYSARSIIFSYLLDDSGEEDVSTWCHFGGKRYRIKSKATELVDEGHKKIDLEIQ